jgi:surface protein
MTTSEGKTMKMKLKRFLSLFLVLLLTLSITGGLAASSNNSDNDGSLLSSLSWDVHADDDIASGIWGTCAWKIDSTGVLTIKAGNGADISVADQAPWHSYATQITSVVTDGQIKLPNLANNLFLGCTKATSIEMGDFDSSETTWMTSMFGNCSSLTSLDLSSFDTSKVTTMSTMFVGCVKLAALDLSGFKTGKVTNFDYMFSNCKALTSLDLSNFDTSSAITMFTMFAKCTSLKYLDISNFDTSAINHVTDGHDYGMESMFDGDSKLWKIKLGPNFNKHGTFNTTGLTSAPVISLFTGNWTRGNSRNHEEAITNTELMDNYDSTYADTWYWEVTGTETIDVVVDKVCNTDNGVERLTGAKLEILDSNNTSVDSWTSADEAHEISLPVGSYTLTEISAPDGYEITDDIQFTISSRGVITIDGETTQSITMVDKKKATPTPTPTATSTATPAATSTPTATATAETTSKSPDTSDNSSMLIWAIALIVAAAGIGGVIAIRRKHSK